MIDIKINRPIIMVLDTTLALCGINTSSIESTALYATPDFGLSQAEIFNDVINASVQVGWNKDYKLPSSPDVNHQLMHLPPSYLLYRL